MNILEQIVKEKKSELTKSRKECSLKDLESFEFYSNKGVSLKKRFETEELPGIIAEFKRKSPSRGWINKDANPEIVCPSYEAAGVSAISVLTDEVFFGGSYKDLAIARTNVNIPLLRKDFMIDTYQIHEAKAWGADLILLIASAIPSELCHELAACAKEIGLEVLLEVHHENELEKYINKDIDFVGVNNRNLGTFEEAIKISHDLASKIPAGLIKIAESSIQFPSDVRSLKEAGYKGFLIGERFMRNENPGMSCREFISQI